MMGQFFISYRRDDVEGSAGRLFEYLSKYISKSQIFIDVNIPIAADIAETIEKSVGSCEVLIALIGKRWLSATDKEGRRRLDDPKDIVRLEIATALKRGIKVIPVLVDGVPMPQSSDLPNDLKPLAGRLAFELSNNRFRSDAERLRKEIKLPRWKQWTGLSAGVIAIVIATAAIFVYKNSVRPPPPIDISGVSGPLDIPPAIDVSAIGIHALHVVELGLDVAFVSSQQSQSMAGAMPPGAQVTEIQSDGAAEKAGLKPGDLIEAVGSQKIETLDDMRKTFRELGPGKTPFTIRRSDVRKIIIVDCPNC